MTRLTVVPIIADRDALLILRERCFRVRRFETFLGRLQMSTSQLEEKLSRLVEDGMLRRIAPPARPEHCDYVLTLRGFDFLPMALSLLRLHRDDAKRKSPRRSCTRSVDGTVFDGIMTCSDCGEVLAREIMRPQRPGRRKDQADRLHFRGPAIPLHCDVPLVQ